MAQEMIIETASAKINLALHVVGQRADGYHLLDTLVTFARAGDELQFVPAARDQFELSGRFAGGLPVTAEQRGGNLVLRARDLLRAEARAQGRDAGPVFIRLAKHLPVASGIGGGSADAAATLRGLMRLWSLTIAPDALAEIALQLGADVPMCLASRPLVAKGIGEDLTLRPDLPAMNLLLVNPLVEVSTPSIFRALTSKNNPALCVPAKGADMPEWISDLERARNDLQPPAELLEPAITNTLELLRATGPLVARMSGSGATCFGIYADAVQCAAAAARLEAAQPGWYVQATTTL